MFSFCKQLFVANPHGVLPLPFFALVLFLTLLLFPFVLCSVLVVDSDLGSSQCSQARLLRAFTALALVSGFLVSCLPPFFLF